MPKIKVKSQTVHTGERPLTKRTDTHTQTHIHTYRTYYLPCYAVDNKSSDNTLTNGTEQRTITLSVITSRLQMLNVVTHNTRFLGHTPKRHLDRFSRFSTIHVRYRLQTNRERRRHSACKKRPRLRIRDY